MRTPILLFLLLTASAATSSAQRPGGKSKDSGPLPLQGKALPDVTAYDETGAEISLRQALKGRHGVIVFGCLT